MNDFRWFRLLLFCLGLYFAGTGFIGSFGLIWWMYSQLTSDYLSGGAGEVSKILLGVVLAAIPHVFTLSFGIYLIRGGGSLTKWVLRRIEHNCMRCDYPLKGVAGTRCPECGMDFDRTKIDAAAPPSPNAT